jgi:hypothetical protein
MIGGAFITKWKEEEKMTEGTKVKGKRKEF